MVYAEFHWNADDPEYSLRTLPLPDLFHLDPWYTVDRIIQSRRQVLIQMRLVPTYWNRNDGEIWIYEPETSISDGVSNVESNGFLDMHNCPPWDLWVGYVREDWRNDVLSWIPASAIPLAGVLMRRMASID